MIYIYIDKSINEMATIDCVRCTALKADGRQCTRRTCKYPAKCWQHTKRDHQLQIKQSGIANAESGLFTTKALKKDDHIANYTGTDKTPQEYEASDSGYGLYITAIRTLDASSSQDGIARYANDCRTANKNAGECRGNNARFKVNHQRNTVRLVATKRIPANTEVFLGYGVRYWQ